MITSALQAGQLMKRGSESKKKLLMFKRLFSQELRGEIGA